MFIKTLKSSLPALALLCSLYVSPSAGASVLTIDNFTHVQTAIDRGNTVGSPTTVNQLTGTDLTNASRTFSAVASGTTYANKEEITSGGNVLKITNGGTSAGTASIVWNFDPINFTAHGNAILLEILSIDLGVQVEMIANGSSTSGVQSFSGPGSFWLGFDEFSNPAAFSNVNSFRLNFSGPAAWDGQFRVLATSFPVPLPPAFWLMGSVLLGGLGLRRSSNR
ncbi:hypothetical protein A1507_04775 [Methylomonas koyamae]|uniref:PEP-CTERM protein-sorting domain-containing protein n=1 Tax=Methylomonas koyamae TaxID=702114 RepID=A0A177NSB8_9GAMM|nr:hypothetical protein [Methylomonas koyamae]OAI20771.1 hypothetical protein A1507_04775 [Methylomonas koyamae]